MLTMPAVRRTAALLTAALVAVVLVTLGGPARTPGQRVTVAGSSHTGTAVKPARHPQAVTPGQQRHSVAHLDSASIAPSATPDARQIASVAVPEPTVVRTGRDLATPTGRAPPAL